MSASALSAIGAILSAFGGGFAQYLNTRSTNEQNQRNYEDWKSYNSPVNQMARLREAGLNPYMVNGMTNTLSEPFNVQNNTGISSALSQMSSAAAQASGTFNTIEQQKIQRDNLELQKQSLDIRRDMVDIARKKGDAYTALLWSQGSLADLNAKFWSDVAEDRVNKYKYETAIKRYLSEDLYPLQLDFYREYYPELVANKQADTKLKKGRLNDIYWSQWFRNRQLENAITQAVEDRNLRRRLGLLNNQLGWANLENTSQLGVGRLGLQRDYYGLARSKWLTGLGMQILQFPFK